MGMLRASATAAIVLALVGCSGGSTTSQTSNTSNTSYPACPVDPISVVVTTNVWGSVADQLAGACANISTVVSSPATDPHDFEPTAATSSAFSSAALVIQNGLGYDAWATRILDSLGTSAPPDLNLGETVGLTDGANPHIWYSPEYVNQSAAAVTSEFKKLLPAASGYFDEQAKAFEVALQPYHELVASIRSSYSGTKIGTTESVFFYMAQATGLVIATSDGYLQAIDNDSEPSAGDVAAFRSQLTDRQVKALVLNVQTQSALAEQLRQVAEQSGVPVVKVTETLTPEGATFEAWQVAQLEELSHALR